MTGTQLAILAVLAGSTVAAAIGGALAYLAVERAHRDEADSINNFQAFVEALRALNEDRP